MALPHARSPAPQDSGNRAQETDQAGNPIKRQNRRSAAREQDVLCVVDKTPTSRLQIAIRTWRGEHKIEIREATSIIAGTYFPAGTPVNIPLDKLGELVAALDLVADEARARGLIGGGR